MGIIGSYLSKIPTFYSVEVGILQKRMPTSTYLMENGNLSGN